MNIITWQERKRNHDAATEQAMATLRQTLNEFTDQNVEDLAEGKTVPMTAMRVAPAVWERFLNEAHAAGYVVGPLMSDCTAQVETVETWEKKRQAREAAGQR